MTRLTVFYDPRCGLCCAARDWLASQRQFVPLVCRPKPDTADELVVQADTGEWWAGDAAWLMTLWALVGYRDWSYRLASPAFRPTVRAVIGRLSAYRGPLSCALGLTPDTP